VDCLDPLHCYVRVIPYSCCSQWVQRVVVYLPIPVPHSLFEYYPYQVRHHVLSFLESANIDFLSLRVNLDMGKTVYASQIMNDPEIPNTIVRTSTLPEELGRITYLLSDKTGTLTQNGMCFPPTPAFLLLTEVCLYFPRTRRNGDAQVTYGNDVLWVRFNG